MSGIFSNPTPSNFTKESPFVTTEVPSPTYRGCQWRSVPFPEVTLVIPSKETEDKYRLFIFPPLPVTEVYTRVVSLFVFTTKPTKNIGFKLAFPKQFIKDT